MGIEPTYLAWKADALPTELHPDNCKLLNFIGCGGWIGTNELRVMSPTSYQTALPRVNHVFLVL